MGQPASRDSPLDYRTLRVPSWPGREDFPAPECQDARPRPPSTGTRPRSRHCEQNWHRFPARDDSQATGLPGSELGFCSPRRRWVVRPPSRLQGSADKIGDRAGRAVHCTRGAWEDMVPGTPSRAGAQVPPLPLPITLNLHQRGAPGLVFPPPLLLAASSCSFVRARFPLAFLPLSTPHQHLRFTRLAFLSSSLQRRQSLHCAA